MTDEEFYKIRENMKEEWKQIILTEEKVNYDVSNTGKIRKHDTKKEVKLSKTDGMKNTYEFYAIKFSDGHTRNVGVHRLMALMFIPIPDKYLEKGYEYKDLVVDHIDNVKYHNIDSNLQWLTQSENTRKSLSIMNINDLIVSKHVIKDICKDLAKGLTIYDISVKYNVSETLVADIRFKRRYCDISDKYSFISKQISEDDARNICELLQKGYSASKISKEYNYPFATIVHILAGDSWKYISKDYKFPNKRINNDTIVYICEELQKGRKSKDIANELNIKKGLVDKIKWGETHTDISKNYNIIVSKFKVSDDIVKKICEDLQLKIYTNQEIADRNKVSITFVKDIKYKKIRTDISSNYIF